MQPAYSNRRVIGMALVLVAVAATVAVFLVDAIGGRAKGGDVTGVTVTQNRLRSPVAAQEDDFRAQLNGRNFGKEKADEVRDKFNLDLSYPLSALGGEYEGVYVAPPTDDGYGHGFVIVYSNDVLINVARWPTARDAKRFASGLAAGKTDAGYGPYLRETRINGNSAYLMTKFRVPPEPSGEVDPETGLEKVAEGTGIGIRTSMVAWSQGRYFVSVSSEEHAADELLSVAQQLRISPRQTEVDEAKGYFDNPEE